MTDTQILPRPAGKSITITIAHRMVLVRNELGLTLEEFADQLAIARSTLTDYEKGRSLPKPHVIERLRDQHGYNAQWIVTGHVGDEQDVKKLLAEPKRTRMQHRHRSLCISASPVLSLERFRRSARPNTQRPRHR